MARTIETVEKEIEVATHQMMTLQSKLTLLQLNDGDKELISIIEEHILTLAEAVADKRYIIHLFNILPRARS